jgi:hypothetical protein
MVDVGEQPRARAERDACGEVRPRHVQPWREGGDDERPAQRVIPAKHPVAPETGELALREHGMN